MNCANCHMPLEQNARFCRNCGAPVSQTDQTQLSPMPYQPDRSENAPTIPPTPWQTMQQTQQQAQQTQQPLRLSQQNAQNPAQPQQTQYQGPTQNVPNYQSGQYNPPSQPGMAQQPGTFQAANELQGPTNTADTPRKKRRGHGCLVSFLVTVLVIVLLLVGAWFVVLRPYLHNLATTQISNTLDNGISQIPAQVALAPPSVFAVQENTLNNLIVLETAPSDPVQHMQMQITPTGVTINFQVYGISNTVTGIPAAQNGHLVVTNVNVQGPASLIMSSGELTTLLDQKLAEAQTKLDHPITAVQLKNQEIDLTLGNPGTTSIG